MRRVLQTKTLGQSAVPLRYASTGLGVRIDSETKDGHLHGVCTYFSGGPLKLGVGKLSVGNGKLRRVESGVCKNSSVFGWSDTRDVLKYWVS